MLSTDAANPHPLLSLFKRETAMEKGALVFFGSLREKQARPKIPKRCSECGEYAKNCSSFGCRFAWSFSIRNQLFDCLDVPKTAFFGGYENLLRQETVRSHLILVPGAVKSRFD